MVVIGVGGADAVDVMAGPLGAENAENHWCETDRKNVGMDFSKDVILKLAGILTVKGGTNAIIEYFMKERNRFRNG